MYLFTRSRRIRPGSIGPAIDWALAAAETVQKATGRGLNAWMSVMSPEAETVTWTMFCDSMRDVVDAGDKLAASASWHDLLQRGGEHFEGPLVDGLTELVVGAPDLGAEPPNFVNVVRAVAANGRLGDAISMGMQLAEYSSKVTALPMFFAVDVTGSFGGVAWFGPAPDIAVLEAARAALNADAEWVALVDRCAGAYTTGATQSLQRRLA
jgi:hypothetical protein